MAKTVLIADDSAMIRKKLCEILLADEGYEVCAEAANGEEAIALAKKHRPDLIILDLSMPVMNGLDAARVLKRVMPEVPIILFTLHTEACKQLPEIGELVDLVVAKNDMVTLLSQVRALVPA
jgi:YesN/AraC family two-component response regulator